MSYASEESVADLLGLDCLSAAQSARLTALLASADATIDAALGTSWLEAGTVTNEWQPYAGQRLYLRHRPVTAVTTLVRTAPSVTTANQTLVAGRDYKLWHAAQGLVWLAPGWADGYAVLATYTHTETVPADVVELATALAAGMLRLTTEPERAGVKRYTLWGGDLSVEYADDASSSRVATLFEAVLRRRRIPVVA